MPSLNPQKLALPSFNEAQVLTILAELTTTVDDLQEQVNQARLTAQSTQAELSNILQRLDTLRMKIQQGGKDIQSLAETIGTNNDQILSLHQDVAILKSQAENLREEIAKMGRNGPVSKLKRERAKINVRIEDKENELNQLKPLVAQQREQLTQMENNLEEDNYHFRAVQKELDNLQAMLPSPYLYTNLYMAVMQEAHANFYLDHDVGKWEHSVGAAFSIVHDLSADIRAGKYRLDRYSDLIGGRSQASVDALYSAVILGQGAAALEFFNITCDQGLYFHNIFNILRCWMLGFYLRGDMANLRELLRYYQHSDGMRRAYVEAFTAILDKNQVLFDRAIRFIVRYEFTNTPDQTPQLICIGALALATLARRHGLQCTLDCQTMPAALQIAAAKRLSK